MAKRLFEVFLGAVFFLLDKAVGALFRKKSIKLSANSKILVVASTGIGNIILLTPMLRDIKRNLPKSNVSVLVRKGLEDVLKLNKDVDNIITYHMEFGTLRKIRFLMGLREKKFDAAFYSYPNVDIMSAVLLFLTGAKKRINFAYSIGAYEICGFLNTLSVPSDGFRHDVERNLGLLRACNLRVSEDSRKLVFNLSKEDEEYAKNALKGKLKKSDFLVGMHLGSNYKPKNWGVENFSRLMEKLLESKRIKIILVGGNAEKSLIEGQEFLADKRVINFVGKASIRQTAALIKRCRLFITNDSGPMHIAAAFGVRTVAIFIASNAYRTGPWSNKSIVISKKTNGWMHDKDKNHIYVDDIDVDFVFSRVEKLVKA